MLFLSHVTINVIILLKFIPPELTYARVRVMQASMRNPSDATLNYGQCTLPEEWNPSVATLNYSGIRVVRFSTTVELVHIDY